MDCQVIIDTDYLLEVSDKINETSNEISNSIISLKKISDDLGTTIQDQNINNFQSNFTDYLSKLNELTLFYNSVSTTISNLVNEYNNIDQSDASKLKDVVENETVNE